MAPKYQQICDDLVQAIRSGIYRTGDRLPTCRELAGQWQVSYMTANKALSRLAQDHYVDLDHGKGTFVRWREDGEFLPERRVTLCISQVDHPSCRFVASEAMRQLRQRGWEVEEFWAADSAAAIEKIRDTSRYSLCFGFNLIDFNDIYNLCVAGRERLVIIAERYERFGISCTCVDNSQAIRLAMNHLTARGCRNIGLLCSNLTHGDELEGAAVWTSISQEMHRDSGVAWQDFLMNWEIPQYGARQEQLIHYLESLEARGVLRQLDALISTDDSKAVVAAGFLLDRGLRVPEDIAVIAINDSELATMMRPQLTTVDTNLTEQVRLAVAMLEEKVGGVSAALRLRCCEPRLIVRQSA